jgi:hypothetical protein
MPIEKRHRRLDAYPVQIRKHLSKRSLGSARAHPIYDEENLQIHDAST